MSRVHPNCSDEIRCEVSDQGDVPSSFTVWKKSSMSFQGTDGFTVFDQKGGLVFRVDNYSRDENLLNGDGLVLMDGVGNVVLALRPQGFSLLCRWIAYKGENRVFLMKRRLRPLLKRNISEEPVDIFLRVSPRGNPLPDFIVEGSFGRRNCIVRRKADGALVARIERKRAKFVPTVVLGDDVFSLKVQPGFDTSSSWVLYLCWIGSVGNRRWRRSCNTFACIYSQQTQVLTVFSTKFLSAKPYE